MSPPEFERSIATRGLAVFPGAIGPELLAGLRVDIARRIAACRALQRRNGVSDGMDGVAHHVVGGGDSLQRFLESDPLRECLLAYFGGAEYILNSYGAVDNTDAPDAYRHGLRFHRDVRTWSDGFRLMINMLVMVDDFTPENGATRYVPGSHRVRERPAEAEFEAAERMTGIAGTIVLFDSNLWHAAAPNRTPQSRRALTLTFTRAFMKQQLDYPRLLGEDFPCNDRMRQLLGYNARVPATLDEWYQPPERRMYKPGQG